MGKNSSLRKIVRNVLPLRSSVFERFREQLFARMNNESEAYCKEVQAIEKQNSQLIVTLKEVGIKSTDVTNIAISRIDDVSALVEDNKQKLEAIFRKIENQDYLFEKLKEQSRLLAMLNRECLVMAETLKSQQENFNLAVKQSSYIDAEMVAIQAKLDEIASGVSVKSYYCQNWEKGAIEAFRDVLFSPDLQSKFESLTRGMDRRSVQTLATIIKRQRIVLDSEGSIDLFTPYEQDVLFEVRRRLKDDVVELDENLFCFDGYLLPIEHFEASVFIYKHGLDEVANLDSLKDKDIIDVGGFVGDSAIIFSSLTDKRVISFEASQENYDLMLKTIELNSATNVVPERLALGAEKGTLSIDYNGSATQASTISGGKGVYSEEVPMIAFDDYCNTHDLDIGLIKVDVEGYEQEFLKGARGAIERYRPILLLSIYHNPDDFFGIKPLIESWGLDYSFSIHKPIDNTVSREVLLIAEPR